MMTVLTPRNELAFEVRACFPGVQWFDVCYVLGSRFSLRSIQPAVVHP